MLVPSWGLNPWHMGHEFYKLDKGLHRHCTMHLGFFLSNIYGSIENLIYFYMNYMVILAPT